MGDKIAEIFTAKDMAIALHDRASGIVSMPYYLEHGQRFEVPSRAGGGVGFTAEVIRTRRPLVINRDVVARSIELGSVTQRGGKVVHAWAVEGELDPSQAWSNTFTMEWPPHSGIQIEVPEIDRVAWFAPDAARVAINAAQVALIDFLLAELATRAAELAALEEARHAQEGEDRGRPGQLDLAEDPAPDD